MVHPAATAARWTMSVATTQRYRRERGGGQEAGAGAEVDGPLPDGASRNAASISRLESGPMYTMSGRVSASGAATTNSGGTEDPGRHTTSVPPAYELQHPAAHQRVEGGLAKFLTHLADGAPAGPPTSSVSGPPRQRRFPDAVPRRGPPTPRRRPWCRSDLSPLEILHRIAVGGIGIPLVGLAAPPREPSREATDLHEGVEREAGHLRVVVGRPPKEPGLLVASIRGHPRRRGRRPRPSDARPRRRLPACPGPDPLLTWRRPPRTAGPPWPLQGS